MNINFSGKILRLISSLFLLVLPFCAFSQTTSSVDELKKQAEKAFIAEDYENSLSPYSQLLSLDPRNSTYNYRYGVSLIMAGKPKSNAVSYLESAAKDGSNPEEVWIYLAKSYMVIGKFQDALDVITKFESIANAAKQKKFESSTLKANCYSAILVLKSRKSITILDSKEVVRNEFYNYYNWNVTNGKMVPAAEQFLTSMDKDKQTNPVMFITNDKQSIYLASYGKKGERGKDIYVIRKQPNGQWSEAQNLGEAINSTANEDFPYLDRDGRTLYFSSKSEKSIGGYDIFKSKYDFNTGQWSTPENLGWPINTIGDDFLYVPITNGTEAFYSTAIESRNKEISLRKIQLLNNGEQLVTITGYYKPLDQKVRRDARVTVLRSGGDGVITSVYTDPQTGKYELTLSPGLDYVLLIEGGGYLPHAESFSIPTGIDMANLRQVVKIDKDISKENLTLENYFYPTALINSDQPSSIQSSSIGAITDSSALMKVQINNETVYVLKPGSSPTSNSKSTELSETNNVADSKLLKIEKKDGYDPTLSKGPSDDELRQQKEELKRTADIEKESKKSDHYDISIDNSELANIAILDAKNSREEADSLKKVVQDLYAASRERDSLASIMSTKVGTANEIDKNNYLNEAYNLKTDADNMRRQAADMEVSAAAKDLEAKNSEQDAKELLAAIKTKSPKSSVKPTAQSKTQTAIRNDHSDLAQVPSHQENEIKELTPEETPVVQVDSSEISVVKPAKELKQENSSTSITQKNTTSSEVTNGSKLAIIDSSNSPNIALNSTPSKNGIEKVVSADEKKSTGKGVEAVNSNTATISETQKEKAKAGSSDDQTKLISDQNKLSITEKTKSSEAIKSNTKVDDVVIGTPSLIDTSNVNKTQSFAKNIEVRKKDNETIEIASPIADSTSNNNSQVVTDENVIHKNDDSASAKVVIEASDTSKSELAISTTNKISNAKSGVNQSTDTVQSILENNNEGEKLNKQLSDNTKTSVAENVNSDSTTHDIISVTEKSKSDSTIKESSNNLADQKKVNSKNKTTNAKIASPKADVTEIPDSQTTGKSNQNDSTLAITNVSQEVEKGADLKNNSTSDSNLIVKDNSESKVNSSSEPNNENAKPFVPPAENVMSFPENINSVKIQPVSEEARIAYLAYKDKYKNSKQLSDQSIELQNRISITKSSPQRDSLIGVSNNLSEESSTVFQEAVAQLKAAQQIDPDVKSKMEMNELVIAYNSSLPTNSARNSTGAKLNDRVNSSQELPAENNSTINSPDLTSNSSNEVVENKANIASQENYEVTPEEAAKVGEMTNFTVTTPNGEEEIKIDTVGINVKHPDFPKYVEMNKKIVGKEVETIDVFAQAVNQNKLAVEQKQEQNRLMDKAETEVDRPTKAQIFIQADKMRDSSKANEKEAVDKFASAQKKTNEVKSLTSEMDSIRKRIAIPGRTLATNATKSVVKPGALAPEEVAALIPTPLNDKKIVEPKKEIEPKLNPTAVSEFATKSFSIAKAPVYNDANPIPMNPSLPDGLVFKVQIGAFKKPIPAEKFEGVQPITAETTRPEWIRYCVGLFQTFEPAVVVKKEMQQRGFKDAFVVAYLNGKRIELTQAYALISGNNSQPSKSYVQNSQNEMALLRANNIRPENISAIRNNKVDADEKDFYGVNAAKVKTSFAAIEYAVQVGVFRTANVPSGLKTLMPLFTEQINPRLYRFTSDHYSEYASADSMKRIARREGVKDAFIVVYRNGVQSTLASVPPAERKTRPLVVNETKPVIKQPIDVSSIDKSVSEKIVYKVQLGAFKNNIPFSSVVTFLAVADKGITQLTDERGLHIFYAGTCDAFSIANTLKDEIVQKGITDAFVVALQNGKRLQITDEMKKQ